MPELVAANWGVSDPFSSFQINIRLVLFRCPRTAQRHFHRAFESVRTRGRRLRERREATQVPSAAREYREQFSESRGLSGGAPELSSNSWVNPENGPNLLGTTSARWGQEEFCEYRAELTPRVPTQVSAAECR